MLYKVECIKNVEPIESYYYILRANDIEQAKTICSNDLYFDYFGEIKEIKEDLDSDFKIVKYDSDGIKQYELLTYEEHLEHNLENVATSSFVGEQIDVEYRKRKKWKVIFSKLLD